jgi:transposase InsO family protein
VSEDQTEFLKQFKFDHISPNDVESLKHFLLQHRDSFAMNAQEMGCTNVIEHRVDLDSDAPTVQRPRPLPPGCFEELKEHLDDLQNAGIIRESHSPFCHQMVFVRKSDGSLRLCQDFRPTNKRQKQHGLEDKYSYSIPRINQLIDCLKGAKIFASLDLFAGYHQIPMYPPHIERTAFSAGPLGFWEYSRMPFGLSGAPSTFQRCMDKVLSGLTMKICCVYLDDIIVFAEDQQQLYQRLETIFDRLNQANLKLKPKKCEFLCQSIRFLGHIVSSEGVQCQPEHIETVSSWPRPSTIKEIQSFLGFANFYRKYIPGFATVARPITDLLKGQTRKCSKHKSKCKCFLKVRVSTDAIQWNEECDRAFKMLKKLLTQAPVLAYPDFDKQFVLHTDASKNGLGAVLYQYDAEEKLRVIAYASRSLSPSERNYSTHKLELLALKWAITDKLAYYLYVSRFPVKVFTDHNPLVYLTTTAKLDALGHRWLAELLNYRFDIFYKPGSANIDADALSRKPHPEKEMDLSTECVTQEIFQTLCDAAMEPETQIAAAHMLIHPDVTETFSSGVEVVDKVDWASEQDCDEDIARLKHLLKTGKHPCTIDRNQETIGVMRYLSHWKSFEIVEGILYKYSNINQDICRRLVIPEHLRIETIRRTHEELGHLGREKTLAVSQERFFWIGLAKAVSEHVRCCLRCLASKSTNIHQKAPLHPIYTSRALEMITIDFLSLEESKGGYANILVITDHFTKYAIAIPTRNQEAKTVAKVLKEHFIVHYGMPERIHSDQGRCFEGKVLHHLCALMGIRKSHSTPYHPQSQGVTERFNATLLSMLRSLQVEQKANWKDYVFAMCHAYNSTRHETTGHTPFYLMFGRKPRLAIDAFLGLPAEEPVEIIQDIHQALLDAYEVATKVTRESSRRYKKYYDRKVKGRDLEIGDLVLVRNVALVGKSKLVDKWNSDIFTVVSQPNPTIPVFRIRSEKSSKEKLLHRNLLLPLQLPRWDKPVPRRRTRVVRERKEERVTQEESEVDPEENLDDVIMSIEPRRSPRLQTPVPEPLSSSTPGVPSREDEPDTIEISEVSERERMMTNESVNVPSVTEGDLVEPVEAEGVAPISLPSAVPGYEEIQYPLEEVLEASPGTEGVLSPGGTAGEQERLETQSNTPPLRRSERIRRPPDWYQASAIVIPDWRERVSFLLELTKVFPSETGSICAALLTLVVRAAEV